MRGLGEAETIDKNTHMGHILGTVQYTPLWVHYLSLSLLVMLRLGHLVR